MRGSSYAKGAAPFSYAVRWHSMSFGWHLMQAKSIRYSEGHDSLGKFAVRRKWTRIILLRMTKLCVTEIYIQGPRETIKLEVL